MKITSEINLTDFRFWSGAKDHSFTYNELKDLEFVLEDCFSEELTDTSVNDMFWFEEEFLCESIGLDYDEYLER